MSTEPPRIVRLLAQAEDWQRMFDAGEVRSRAEIARRAGVSATRVTQILALLTLDSSTKERIRGLPPGTPERLVTERSLRTVARLEQVRPGANREPPVGCRTAG